MPAPETFGIVAVRPDESTAAVSPTGDLDVSTSPRLLACIDELLAEGRSRITLDMRAVTFIDSSGLGALVKAHKRAAPSAQLTVVQPMPHVHRAMEISGILKVIRVELKP
ncbi:MAG: STAS domain-containing protein [Acidimicrobiales bacterium]